LRVDLRPAYSDYVSPNTQFGWFILELRPGWNLDEGQHSTDNTDKPIRGSFFGVQVKGMHGVTDIRLVAFQPYLQ
jgi:hypothetical protein